jgi:hypothetical protein
MTEIATTALDKIAQALSDFARSPRFSLFKDIQVGRLMPEECEGDSPLFVMTFEALVARARSLSEDSQLCTPAQAESLLQLLAALSEEPIVGGFSEWSTQGATHVLPNSAPLGGMPNRKQDRVQEPTHVLLEEDLQRLLSAIKTHPNYTLCSARTLGEFWDPSWNPAPFEEALTIRQLLSMDVATLFKKKTVSEERIAHVCQALRSILTMLDGRSGDQSSSETSPRHQVTKTPELPTCTPQVAAEYSVAARAVYEAFVRGYEENRWSALGPLAGAVLSYCTPDEVIAVVLGKELPPKLAHRVATLVGQHVQVERLNLVRKLLEGPAVQVDYIAQAISSPTGPTDAFLAALATVIARGVGASHVELEDRSYAGLWTLHPGLLALIVASQRRAGRGSADSACALDPFLLQLIQVQGRTKVKRKGRPKRLKSRR